MNTAFNIGDLVEAQLDVQGLEAGRVYSVEDISVRATPFGEFVTYLVTPDVGAGDMQWVGNGHLVLKRAEVATETTVEELSVKCPHCGEVHSNAEVEGRVEGYCPTHGAPYTTKAVRCPLCNVTMRDDQVDMHNCRFSKPETVCPARGDDGPCQQGHPSDATLCQFCGNDIPLPRYDAEGMRLTDCCAAYSTYVEATLCCKACYCAVDIGQGDGNEHRTGPHGSAADLAARACKVCGEVTDAAGRCPDSECGGVPDPRAE